MTEAKKERLSFKATDTHVASELLRAEIILRTEDDHIIPDDAEAANLLADVFKSWAFLGKAGPDLLNRAGGSEVVRLARHVIAQFEAEPLEPCPCRVDREPDGERIHVHCNDHCLRVAQGDWERCMGC